MEKRCAYCDAELHGGRRDRKYCNASCRGLHHYHRTADALPAKVPQTQITPSKSRKLRELAEIQAKRERLGLPQLQLEPWLCALATFRLCAKSSQSSKHFMPSSLCRRSESANRWI